MKDKKIRYYARCTLPTEGFEPGQITAFPEETLVPELGIPVPGFVEVDEPLDPDVMDELRLVYWEPFKWTGAPDDPIHQDTRLGLLGAIRFWEADKENYPDAGAPYDLLEEIAGDFANHYISAEDFFDLTAEIKHLFI